MLSPGSRVLVIRPGALGDTILSLPAIRSLRCAVGPNGRIEVVGYPTPLELVVNPGHADVVHSVDRRLFSGLFSPPSGIELESFLESFDFVVVWCNDRAGHLTGLLRKLKLPHVQARPFPPGASDLHAADYLLQTLAPFGIDGTSQPELRIPQVSAEVGASILRKANLWERNFLALHPGSGSPSKNWEPRRFSELACLAKRSGVEPVLIEGPADQKAVQIISSTLGWNPHTLNGLSLPVLASILARAWAYVGNDSGISHLSAASGSPSFVLFGPTNPANWAPRGPEAHVMSMESSPVDIWHAISRVKSSSA